jgi:CheY-like chemotaxis protein
MDRALGILYVDDNQTQLDAFRQSLADGPYRVWTATNARDAQSCLEDLRLEVVVIDYHMPDMTGDRCLQILKRTMREGSSVRFYLYTTDQDAFRRHREMGFDGVLMLKGKSTVRNQIDAIARTLSRFKA